MNFTSAKCMEIVSGDCVVRLDSWPSSQKSLPYAFYSGRMSNFHSCISRRSTFALSPFQPSFKVQVVKRSIIDWIMHVVCFFIPKFNEISFQLNLRRRRRKKQEPLFLTKFPWSGDLFQEEIKNGKRQGKRRQNEFGQVPATDCPHSITHSKRNK